MNWYHLTINWVYLALLSALFFGLAPVFLKASLKRTKVWVSMASAVTVQTILLLAFYPGKAAGFFTAFRGRTMKSWLLLILIAIVFFLSTAFFFLSLQKAGLSRSLSLFSLRTLLLPILFYFLFQETMAAKNWYALGIALIGLILLLIGGEGKSEKTWILFSILSLGFNLLGQVLNRFFDLGLDGDFQLAFLSFFSSILSWILLLIQRGGEELKRVTVYQGFFMAAGGLLSGLAVVFLRQSQSGGQGIVYTLHGLALPIAILTAAALLREKLTGRAVLGMLLLTVGLMLPNLL